MSRHSSRDAAARWRPGTPRGYRPAPSGLKGLRPLRGGLRPPLTPETSGGPGRASRTGSPEGLPGNAAATLPGVEGGNPLTGPGRKETDEEILDNMAKRTVW